jgi:hypothetical protein
LVCGTALATCTNAGGTPCVGVAEGVATVGVLVADGVPVSVAVAVTGVGVVVRVGVAEGVIGVDVVVAVLVGLGVDVGDPLPAATKLASCMTQPPPTGAVAW